MNRLLLHSLIVLVVYLHSIRTSPANGRSNYLEDTLHNHNANVDHRNEPNRHHDEHDRDHPKGDTDNRDNVYGIGFGIADITGPAVEINMMGYAHFGQDGGGIHTRLYSRASIVVDGLGNRICYVNVDLCGAPQLAKTLVIERLHLALGSRIYTHENLLISATHTHSGPGGYFQYFLYIITTEGFNKQSFNAIVDGIVESILKAHKSIKSGRIYYNKGDLLDASANRSPASYALNPKEERERYEYNTDKTMYMLKFTDLQNNPLGMINWFAVHCVSMNNSNHLVSSDNKGYAAIKFESNFNGYKNVGKGPFVAIFSQANEGDSTSNTREPICINTGEKCDRITSTCGGKNEYCVSFGPGRDMFESTKIIGHRQYRKATELFQLAERRVSGPIAFIYQNINMTKRLVTLEDGTEVKTCSAALGHSFAAGTTDGEGDSHFTQGTTAGKESKLFDAIRNLLKTPSQESVECQKPKAILLPVGEMTVPFRWTAEIIPTQILQIGDVVIVALPGEFTTMSGRRIRNDVMQMFRHHRLKKEVILAGLANTYTNYVTTFEEYQLQRYEGGSTLFGAYTLDAYREQYKYLTKKLIEKERIPFGEQLPNFLEQEFSLKPGVFFDHPQSGHEFGDVLIQPLTSYTPEQTVEVKFIGANPRNNLRTDRSYLTVERFYDSVWEVIATDGHWETMFKWERKNIILGTSEVTIVWNIPKNCTKGVYRIRYFGDGKSLLGKITSFTGTTQSFHVE
ncbi:syntaxin [Sarcoptes scabiei]|nr:syntaxin [Sarcoptes scabiei]